ncbi:MAG: glycosyltransferase family 2 protein [Chitinivibrionales bacterium]|nr:glycosyltransferase family 2 protein [Chitinivibrionales bacterium]
MNVDIIITTYKRYDYLQEALRSVAAQSYRHWKCWIAEDGESPETYEAVKPFLKDSRFIYLPGSYAGFPAVPRNRAIRQGNSPLIAILDDDDFWLPQKLEIQVAFLESYPDCVLSGCNAYYWEGTAKWDESPLYFDKKKMGKLSYYTMLQQNYIIHSSAVIRRSVTEKAGLYSEKLNPPIGEDYELYLRVGALGEIYSLPEPYLVYRKTPSTFYTNLNRSDKYKLSANIFESALNGVEDISSPLSYPENAHLAAACRRERDFYLTGPRFLGRLRHELQSEIKQFLKFKKM